jgi:hypothetical protein
MSMKPAFWTVSTGYVVVVCSKPAEVRIKELRAQVSLWEWWLSGNQEQSGGSSKWFDKIKLNQQVEPTS